MTDNLFEGLRSSNSKPYHFYKVVFTVTNKRSDMTASYYTFITSYCTLNWLNRVMFGFDYLPSIGSAFSFTFRFIEVGNNDKIMFHHIKDRVSLERFVIGCFLEICANHKWHLSIIRKVSKLLHRFSQSIKKPTNSNISRVFMFN